MNPGWMGWGWIPAFWHCRCPSSRPSLMGPLIARSQSLHCCAVCHSTTWAESANPEQQSHAYERVKRLAVPGAVLGGVAPAPVLHRSGRYRTDPYRTTLTAALARFPPPSLSITTFSKPKSPSISLHFGTICETYSPRASPVSTGTSRHPIGSHESNIHRLKKARDTACPPASTGTFPLFGLGWRPSATRRSRRLS